MIPLVKPNLGKNAAKYINQCLKTNWLSQGEFNKKLEEKFSSFCGTKYASSCSNGTAALYLALKACGVGSGDEVIVPTLTFAATISAVVMAGAKPVFADINEHDYNISVAEIQKLINPKVKAIIPVHLYGVPAEMDEILDIAQKNKCFVIEDSAEAIGSEYKNKKTGSMGNIGCFSFYGNKVITTGEGGMCITNSLKLNEKINEYKNHGMSHRRPYYWHEVVGTNARLTNIQSAIGFSQIEIIRDIIKKRVKVHQNYLKELKGTPGIILTNESGYKKITPWLFVVRLKNKDKEKIVKKLIKNGVEARPGFYPCHQMPAFSKYVRPGQKFSVANRVSKGIINLPLFPELKLSQQKEVVKKLKEILKD
ncbi:MAG: DegT/DnrJ/EryC1/StrS family aminotransferase [bacterium]|nr:DegT/DnrJ/EryC1/StrS family aminotransferase [bacterium]